MGSESSHSGQYELQRRRVVNDPLAHSRGLLSSVLDLFLATALFKCWHLVLVFAAWATMVALLQEYVIDVTIHSTILTVFGTALGFVISYRTTASLDRFNEGRRYWHSIIHGNRILARLIWYHVPDFHPATPIEERAAVRVRTIIEKKTAVSLLEAFSVAVKHYLRGEESIYYEDLYPLVRFLPAFAKSAGRTSHFLHDNAASAPRAPAPLHPRRPNSCFSHLCSGLPLPNLTRSRSTRGTGPRTSTTVSSSPATMSHATHDEKSLDNDQHCKQTPVLAGDAPMNLLPGYNPPRSSIYDVFPLSLFVPAMLEQGKDIPGRTAAKVKASTMLMSQNIPLEISLYLNSYVAALQGRQLLDTPTTTESIRAIIQLVDALTGLERILSTPIPFSYSFHLWTVTSIYILLLPFQLWGPLHFLAIPSTAIAAFIFFGFLAVGGEIENPFGYDKNDLNLDYFTHITRVELEALTSCPTPDIADWAFAPDNDGIIGKHGKGVEGVTPEEWLSRGEEAMRAALRN